VESFVQIRRDRARRVAVATKLLARDLFRRRIAVALLFVVPALFVAVVLATTVSRQVQVTLGTLVEAGATIETPESPADPLDTNLDDNGSRHVDERQLSLVFLGTAAVCFLACFLAFNLVHKRREVDARLVLAGYRAHELVASKLLLLLGIVAALAIYESVLIRAAVAPRNLPLLLAGFFAGGALYGCLGLLTGALVKNELEGIFVIVFLTNIDVGWLQNPIYYSHSQRRALIEALPGYGPVQLSVVGALTDDAPHGAVARSLAYAAVLVLAVLVTFGLRIVPRRLSVEGRRRLHFAKVLGVVYLLWIAAFEAVGRYAATLHTVDLTTAWDRAIPLVPAFVWPYEACYVLPLLVLFVLRDWHRFNVAVVAIAIANITAFAVYLAVPISFPRPPLGVTAAERVLALEYAADFWPGANKLPSMHVAMSWILVASMWRQSRHRAVDGFLALLLASITIAPLFVKQHLIVDVAVGVPWGIASYAIAKRLYDRVVDPSVPPEVGLSYLFQPKQWALRKG
jgi:hypothetical protein